MKKFKVLLLVLFLGIFLFPKNVFAADYDISSVTSAVAYFDGCMGTSDNCSRVTSNAPSLTLPIYPLHYEGNNPYASINHHQLDFAFRTPVTLNGVKAYNFEIAFSYAMSGLQKAYHYEPVQVLVYPYNGRGYVKNFSGVTTTSVDISNNKIVATGTIELAQTLDINYLVAEFAGKDGGALGYCSSFPGSTIPGCSNSAISQLSLLSISITPIIDTGDALLNDIVSNTQVTNEKLDELINDIGDDDVSGANDDLNGFFDNFEDNHHGLSSVITAPLVFIRNLLNHSCSPLRLELPFVDSVVNLPCMKAIYQEHFGLFFNLYQTITTGVIAYAVLIRIFAIIKGLQDPQNDKIEVFHL